MQPTSTSRSETPKLRRLSRSSSFSSTTGSIKHDTRVQVFVRARPPEDTYETESSLEFPSNREIKLTDPKQETTFKFDHVFPPSITNQEVCDYICSPLINSVLDGYNGSFMVYGQTGSGKTFTVQAEDGLISTTITQLFSQINEDENHNYKVYLSYLQIYHERIYDLLDPSKETDLHLREHPDEGVIVEGLSELNIKTTQDAEELLQFGRRQLVVAETRMVRLSSRSHSLCIIRVDKSRRIKELERPLSIEDEMVLDPLLFKGAEAFLKGKLYLCDLAGSERLKKSGVTGDRLKEARYINSSLLELGNVIHALSAAKSQHVPFRNSTLTRILKESLGGNSRASLMICVSSSIQHISETKCSLNFGQRALRVTKSSSPNVETADESGREIHDQLSQFAQAYPIMKPRAPTMLYPKIDYKALSEYLSKKLKELEMAYQQEKQSFKKMKEEMKVSRKGSSKIPVLAGRRTSTISKESSSHKKEIDTAHDEVFTDAPTTASTTSGTEPKQVKGIKRKESVDSKNIPEKQERKRKQSRLPRIKKPSLPSFPSDNEEQSPVATVAKTKVDMETCTDDDLQLLTREMILDEIQLIKSYSSMSCQTDENSNYVMTDGSDFESDRMTSNIMTSQIITRDMMTSGTMTDDMMTSEWSRLPLIASVLSDDISNDMQEKLSTAELAQFTSTDKSTTPRDIQEQLGELLDREKTRTVTSQSGKRKIDEIKSTIKSICSETQTSFSTSDSTKNRSGEFLDSCNKQAATLQTVGSQNDKIMDVVKDDSPTTKHIGSIEHSSKHRRIETMDSTLGNEILHDTRADKAGITRGLDSCHDAKDDTLYCSKEVQKHSSPSDCRNYKNVSENYEIDTTKDDAMVIPESKEKSPEESFAHMQYLDGRSESKQRYANDQNRMIEVSMESEILEEKPISEIASENTEFGETIKKHDNISKQGESKEISHDAKEICEREIRVHVFAENKGISDTIIKSKELSRSLELEHQKEHAVDSRKLSDKIPANFEEKSQREDGKNVSQKDSKDVRESKTNIPKIIQSTEVKDQLENSAIGEKVVVAKSAHLHEVPQKERGVTIHHKSIATAESIIDNKTQHQRSEISDHLEQTANTPSLSDAFSADREKSIQTKEGVDVIRKCKELRASPADGTDSSQRSEFKARIENTENDLLQREVGTAGVDESGGIEADGRKQIIDYKNHLQNRTSGLTKVGETICLSHLDIMGEKEKDQNMNRVELKIQSSVEDGQIESSASHGAKGRSRDESLAKNNSMKRRVNERDDFKGEKEIFKDEYKTSDSSMKNEANEITPLVKTEGNEGKGADSIEKTCLRTLPDEVRQRRKVRNMGVPMKIQDAVEIGRPDASKQKTIHEEVLPRVNEPRHELYENKKPVGRERNKQDDERHLLSFQTDSQESEKEDREDNIIEILSLEENAKTLASLNSDSFSQSMSSSQSEPSISNMSPQAAETGQFRDTIDGSKIQNDMAKTTNKQEENVDSIRKASLGIQVVQEQRLNETSSRPVPGSDVFESKSAMNSQIHRKEALLDNNEIGEIMETKSLTETKASPSLNSEKIPDSKPKTAKMKDCPSTITNKNFLSSEAAPEIRGEDGRGTADEERVRETWPPLPGKETKIGPTSDAETAPKSNTEQEMRETTVPDDAIMSSRPYTIKIDQVAHAKNVMEEQIPTCIEAGSQESEMRFEEMSSQEKKEEKKVAGAIQGNEREVTLNKNRMIGDMMSLENASDGGGNSKQTEKDNFIYSCKEDSRETNAEARTISAKKYEGSADHDRPKTEGQPIREVINNMTAIKQEKSVDRINNNETSDYVVIWDDIDGHEKFDDVTFEQKTVSEYVIVDKHSNNEIHCAQLQSGSTSRANDARSKFSLSENEKVFAVQGEDETDGTWSLSDQLADANDKGKGRNSQTAHEEMRNTKTIEPDLDSRQLASDTVIENLRKNIVLTDKESTNSTIIHPALKLRDIQFSEGTTGSQEDTRIKHPTLIQYEGVSVCAQSDKVLARSEMQQGEERGKTPENSNVKMKLNGKEEVRKDIDIRLSKGMVSDVVFPSKELSLSEETVACLPLDAVKSKSKEKSTTDNSFSTLKESSEAETKTGQMTINDRSQRSSLGQESIRRVSLTPISSLSHFKDVMMPAAIEPEEEFSDIGVEGTAISKNADSYLRAKIEATDEQTQSSQQDLMYVGKKVEIGNEGTVVTELNAQGLGKISPKAKRGLVFELEIEESKEGTQTLQIEVCSEEEFVDEKAIRESGQRKGKTNGNEQISRDISEQLDDFKRRNLIKQADRGTEGEYLHDDSTRKERGFENQQLSAKVEVEGQRSQGERAIHATQRERPHKDRDLPIDKLNQLDDMGEETQIRQQRRETGREIPVQVIERERGTKNELVEAEVKPEVQKRGKQHEESSMRTSSGNLIKDSGETELAAKEMGKEEEQDEIPPLPRKQTVGQMNKSGQGSKEEEDEMPPLPRKQNVGLRKKQGEGTVTKEGTVCKQEGEKDAKKVVSKTRESDKNEADSDVKKESIKTQLSIEKTEELVLGLLTIGSGREDFASTKLTNTQMERETRGMSNRLEKEQEVQSENNEYKLLDSCIGKERPAEIKEAVIVENEERMRRISIGEARIIPPKPKAVQFKEIGYHCTGLNTKQDGREMRGVEEERDSSRTTARNTTALLAIVSDTQMNATGRTKGKNSSSQEEGTHLAPLQIYTHSLNDSMSYSEQSSISPTPSGTSTESEFTVALKEKDKLKKALSTVKNQYEGLLQEFDKIISTNGTESGNENVQISKESYQVALQCKEELEMEITKAREQLAFVVAAHEDQSDNSLFWQSSEYEFSEDSESFTDRSFDITDESGGFPRGMSTPVPPTAKGTKRDSSTQSGSVREGIKDTQTLTQNESLLGVRNSDVRRRPTPDVQERATNTSPESESDSKYRRSPRYTRPGYDSFNEVEEELGYTPISDLQRLPATLPRRRAPKRRHRGITIPEDMDPNETKWVSRKSLVNKEQAKRNEKLTLQAIENAELKKELLLTKLEKIRLEAMLSCVMMRVSPTEVDQGFRQMSLNSITSSTSTLRSTASLTNIPQNDPGNPFQPTSPFRRMNARQAPSVSGSESGRATQQRVRFEELRKTPSSTLSPRSSSLFCHSSLLTQSSLSPSSIDFDISSCTSSDFRSTPVPMERVSPCCQDGDENIISPSTNKEKADGQTAEEEIEIAYRGKGKMNLGSCLPFRKKKKSPKKSSKKYKERSQSETSMDDSYGADC